MGEFRDVARLSISALRTPRVRDPPLVSVVIATYNYSAVLRHAVASALNQRYTNIEVLVVGDGCTDDSEAVVAAAGDPRVRWHNLATNSGSQFAPNNAGIAMARGELIAYHGHDDIWTPNHLAHLVAAMRRHRADLANTAMLTLGPPGSNIRDLHGLYPHPDAPGWRAPSSVMHTRELAERAGPWRDYREMPQPPDEEFMERAAGVGTAIRVPALTVFKLSATLRPDCYVNKPDHEQAALLRRVQRQRTVVHRELVATAWAKKFRSVTLPEGLAERIEPEPAVLPPGWKTRQYRRIRGLE